LGRWNSTREPVEGITRRVSGSIPDDRPVGVGTARSRDQEAVFSVVVPASAETKVGIALDSSLSNICVATSPNDCKVGGTVNTAVGGHRQQPLHCGS
jgi:hypothetical protein